mmetsp:Transcript_46908/g.69390  ORF Transcript_46908/g.69390 Transcript_46908/m.69390 type:complete len:283 (+) Transcript_46908:59-907(+)
MAGRSSFAVAAAGSVLLVAAAGTALNRYFTKPSSSTDIVQISDIDHENEDTIQAEDVEKVFDSLFLHMQAVLAQLSQQIQQIQAAGQMIPEGQLRQILKGEFERALLAKQGTVFEENDVDEDCLKEATLEFMSKPDEYPKVKKSVERFQKLYENVSGESVVSSAGGKKSVSASTEELTQGKLLEAAGVYFDAITNKMKEIVEEFKSKGMNLSDPAIAQKFHIESASKSNEAGEKALEKLGITVDQFRSSIEKLSSNPEVGRTLAMLQMKQQQELMAMGFPAM